MIFAAFSVNYEFTAKKPLNFFAFVDYSSRKCYNEGDKSNKFFGEI